MGVRTGAEYLAGLRDARSVWIRGERVRDVTTHPGLARGAATMAALLDRQHDPDRRDLLTVAGEDGTRHATSFLRPTTKDDLARRSAAMYDWAIQSGGMLGRTGDYLNSSLMAFAAAADFFAAVRPELGENVTRYYRHVRDHDLVLTHTLVNPQVNRRLTAAGVPSPEVALHMVDRNARGIVVRGARLLATLGPLSDEIVVFPSTILKNDPASGPYALAFALPNATPGMRFVCRDSYDEGKSAFDAPLSSRFEEMDAVVFFDDVLVPWERVFLVDDMPACNDVFAATRAVVHLMHQVACKNLAKAEFLVGLLCAMTRASERDELPQVQGMVAEAMWTAETMRALLRTAEADAAPDRWGTMTPSRTPLDTARNLFPRLYPRLVELVQLLGSSSLMATPCADDFENELAGDVQRYFQLAHADAHDRVALFRLAQDVAASGFGARQVLYERFFFGPPEMLAANYYRMYEKDPLIGRVRDLLARTPGD